MDQQIFETECRPVRSYLGLYQFWEIPTASCVFVPLAFLLGSDMYREYFGDAHAVLSLVIVLVMFFPLIFITGKFFPISWRNFSRRPCKFNTIPEILSVQYPGDEYPFRFYEGTINRIELTMYRDMLVMIRVTSGWNTQAVFHGIDNLSQLAGAFLQHVKPETRVRIRKTLLPPDSPWHLLNILCQIVFLFIFMFLLLMDFSSVSLWILIFVTGGVSLTANQLLIMERTTAREYLEKQDASCAGEIITSALK